MSTCSVASALAAEAVVRLTRRLPEASPAAEACSGFHSNSWPLCGFGSGLFHQVMPVSKFHGMSYLQGNSSSQQLSAAAL